MMVDLSFLENFTKGNPEKIERYIRLYLKIAPECLNRMKEDVENENWADLRINAHSLKPQADYVGIASLKETLINIEEGVKNGKTSTMKNLCERADQLHREAAVVLNKKLLQM